MAVWNIGRWVRCVVGVVALGLLALFGAVIGAGFYLSSPAPEHIGVAPAELQAEDVVITSGSGARLHGWFIEAPAGGGAVILMHGVRGNRLAMLRRATLFKSVGFSILLFDFQAHGESAGERITFGRLEALDAAAAVTFVRRRLPHERIGVVGSSLGGAAALLGPTPLAVDALVLESVYSDIGTAIANRVRMVLGPVIGMFAMRPTAWLFELILPPFLGMRPADLRPIDHMARIAAPVMIASGTRDTRTTMAETRRMFDRAPEPKTLWAVEGADHVDLEGYDPEAYRARVVEFLAAWLRSTK